MIFFTSDCHFNHNNILKYEPVSRPFETVDEMNEAIIKNWNDKVTYEDTVYVIGDFFLGRIEDIKKILCRLNGKIILIRGNHDTAPRIELYKDWGIEVKDFDHFKYKGKYFLLCHFPIVSQEFFNMMTEDNKEVILLYGHVHSKAPRGYHDQTFHVGVDTNNLTPVSADEIVSAAGRKR